MRIRSLSFVLCCAMAIPAFSASYDVHADFSNSNPSGPWKYGYAGAGGLGTLDTSFLAQPTFSNCVGGLAACWLGTSSAVAPFSTFNSGTVNFIDGYVTMHPGANLDLSVIGFVAPVAANYTFSGEFMDHDVQGGNGVSVASVLGDGTQLLGPTTLANVFSPVTINFSRNLSAGETVYFAVGANGEWSFDSVGLKLNVADDLGGTVPEPSTWALTGIASAVAIAWRKRG